jgi:hypothetical protein
MTAKKANPKNPSKYDPAMCDRMIELGKLGASQKIMWSELGISKGTAESWKKKYPDFADALDLALVHSQAYYERLMLANVDNKNFNSRLIEIALRGQHAADYKETRDTKIEAKIEAKIDFQKEIANLISALKQ